MWLTRLALKNPVFILMMSLMAILLGFVSLNRLSVDLFPNIDIPNIRVATFYPGAGPADIEQSITQPIERAISASPGVERVESSSKQGVSIVNLYLAYGTNLDNAQFDVSQRITQILSTLPPGIQQPFVMKYDVTNIPICQISVTSDELDERQLYDLAYNTIEPQIERLPGIASASVSGGKTREIDILAHRDALRARNLGILDLVQAVANANLLLPSGDLRAGDRDYNVYSNNQIVQIPTLGNVVLARGSGSGPMAVGPVRISDVAKVVDGTADQTEIVRVNGQRGVFLRVLKQPGANTVSLVDAVRAALPQLRGVPSNIHTEMSFDQSTYIRNAIHALAHEAIQGGVLAILVILIFLASFRATGIVATAIPLSIVATFALLYFAGQTLNIFTLGGLALGVGRLIDDSIVELENIHRHMETGANRTQAVLAAAQEVAGPIFVSTITTIVVFFPVLFLTGVARSLFVPLAMTISFALFMSFIVSRTVTPLLCLRVMETSHKKPWKPFAWVLAQLDRLNERYAGGLRWVLRHRAVTAGGIALFFLLSLGLGKFIGTSFFPDTDESQFTIQFKAPIGTRVEETEKKSIAFEEAIQKTLGKDAQVIISSSGIPTGRAAVFSPNTGPHAGRVQVNLPPGVERNYSDVDAVEKVRADMKNSLPGVPQVFIAGGIVKRIVNFGSPAPIDVEILGYDQQSGAAYARALFNKLNEIRDTDGKPLMTDLDISREENYPELRVEVDREKAGILGLTENQIAQSVLTSLTGSNQISPVLYTDPRTGNLYNVSVRLDDPYRTHVDNLDEIFLRAPSGAMVQLSTVAKIHRSSGPVSIDRRYLQRVIDVTANIAPGKDLGSATAATQKVLDQMVPPEGFTAQLGGQSKAQNQAFGDLKIAALLALALVYMVLASQFKSLIDPFVIMFSVPLGISGVLIMLWLTRTQLSVNSFMGIIMMVGIVVSNGVLLVDFANHLRGKGMAASEAIVEAGRTRLRPILMTTIATIVGLIPMALGIGEGSETNLPLARAVIGGLTVSTFFTLFLVPVLYTLAERFSKRKFGEEAEGEGTA